MTLKTVCWLCAAYYYREDTGEDCGDEETHKEIKELLDYFSDKEKIQ